MDDASTAAPAAKGDETKWERLADVVWMPGIDCKGGKRCRGDLVAVYGDEGELVRPSRQKMG
jgi:hypothetical protein